MKPTQTQPRPPSIDETAVLLAARREVREKQDRLNGHLAHKDRQDCLRNIRDEVESWRAPGLYWYWMTAPKELAVKLSSARHAQAALGMQ